MASIITTISLTPETKAIASQLPNFSGWIQGQLLLEASSWGQTSHTQPEEYRKGGLCNPLHKTLCLECWPQGRPLKVDWFGYCKKIELGYEGVAKPPIDPNSKIDKIHLTATKQIAENESQKTSLNITRNAGILKRVWHFLW